jgi:hypothetical protein
LITTVVREVKYNPTFEWSKIGEETRVNAPCIKIGEEARVNAPLIKMGQETRAHALEKVLSLK